MQKSKLQFKQKFLKAKSLQLAANSYFRGFTLIETMVALAIFSVSVVSLIVMTSQGVANVSLAKNKLIASYLAQEGIEVVRNNRDSLGFDSLNPGPYSPLSGDLFYSTDNGYNNISGGSITPFKRKVTVNVVGKDEVKVSSEVKWVQGQGPGKSVTYSENLFNWHWQ